MQGKQLSIFGEEPGYFNRKRSGRYKTSYKDSKEEKTMETYTQNLTKLLGDNSDIEWKKKWLEYQQEEQKEQR